MAAQDNTASGIENTAERDPLLHLMGALGDSDSYITGMEAAGQSQLVNSTMLPTKMNSGSDDDLRALGFDDEWASAEAVRAAVEAIRDRWVREQEIYPGEYTAEQIAKADKVLASLPGGES